MLKFVLNLPGFDHEKPTISLLNYIYLYFKSILCR